jgi:hypothetical protein
MGVSKRRFIELLTLGEPSHWPSNDPEESQRSPTGSRAIGRNGRGIYIINKLLP